VDATLSLTTEIRTLQGDMEEKKRRMDKAREDIKAANYEERIAEKTSKARGFEEQRDDLNAEFRSLNLQADSRARLDLKRDEMKSKKNELKNTLVKFIPTILSLMDASQPRNQ
jgi:DNA repair protein RAD50